MQEEESTLNWKMVLQYGLLGGLVTLYLSAVGMVEVFATRNLIGTLISMGDIMIFMGAFGAGLVTRKKFPIAARGTSLLAGAVSGAVSSLPLILIIFIAQFIALRNVFVNITPGLISELTFNAGNLIVGNLLLLVVSAVLGVIGTGLDLLPERLRRAITNGAIWTLTLGLFSENVGQIITSTFSFILGDRTGIGVARSINQIIFQSKSLTILATVVVFSLIFVLTYTQAGNKTRTRFSQLSPTTQKNTRRAGLVFLGLIILLLPQLIGTFLSQVIFLVGMFTIMGLGLNIVVGFAGLLDLGYVAFFAFGAYTMALLTTQDPNLAIGGGHFNFFTALPIAVVIGVLFGTVLGFPVLRLRGDYLAIVTLGFGEIIRVLALSDWFKPFQGGAQGVLKIPSPAIGSLILNGPELMYYPVLIGAILAAFVSMRLRTSRLGRQWMAMREDEDVAEAMGIHLIQTKLLAFSIGAGFSALAGALFAVRLGTIFPHSFGLLYSINALALIIVGGMGSIPGVLVGAFILVGMPELLREFAEYRLLMYGILLIIMMLVKPEGFLPEEVRRRELHVEEELATAD